MNATDLKVSSKNTFLPVTAEVSEIKEMDWVKYFN